MAILPGDGQKVVDALTSLKQLLENGYAISLGQTCYDQGRNVTMWLDFETDKYVVETWDDPGERRGEANATDFVDAFSQFIQVTADIATVEELFLDEVQGDGD